MRRYTEGWTYKRSISWDQSRGAVSKRTASGTGKRCYSEVCKVGLQRFRYKEKVEETWKAKVCKDEVSFDCLGKARQGHCHPEGFVPALPRNLVDAMLTNCPLTCGFCCPTPSRQPLSKEQRSVVVTRDYPEFGAAACAWTALWE